MKSAKSLILLSSALLFPVAYASLPVGWSLSPSSPISAPVLLDSVNAQGKAYRAEQIMANVSPMRKAGKNILAPDTLLNITPAGQTPVVQSAFTRLRSPKFAKGVLTVNSPARHIVYLDGKEVGRSDKQGGKTTVNMSMEPERDYALSVTIFSMPDDTVKPTVSLDWKDDNDKNRAVISADAAQKRRMQLDDTALGNRVTGAAISPDGRWVLINENDMVDAAKSISTLKLRDLRTGAEKILNGSDELKWMPTSSILYSVESGKNGYDVFLVDPADLSRKKVASGLPQKAITWTPSEKMIIYTEPDKAKAQDGPLKRLASPVSRIPGAADKGFLMAFDPQTGISRQLTYGGSPMICDINPKNDAILFMAYEEVPTERPFDFFTLMELNPATMQLDTIVPRSGFIKSACYSPDGSQLLITASADEFDGVGRKIGKQAKVNDYDAQAFILDRASGKVEPISVNFDPSIDGAVFWAKDGNIYMQVTEGFTSPVYQYSPKSRTYTKLPLGMQSLRSFSMADNGSALAYWGQNNNYAGSLRVYDIKKKKDTLVDDPLAERLAELDFGNYEPWNFTASDGTTIEGYICYPPDFDSSKKYPLIVYYYGGTLPTLHGMSNPYTPQLFASRDYVVYVLNPSGTVGYGQEFAARHVNAWGKRTAEDIIEGTEQLCAAHPFIDKDKIGCLGASYGGFMTQYLQTLTPMFAAAVSHAGISDVTSYWGEGYWGYSYNATAAADSYPWQDPDLFTKQGSLFNADKINTPLLLLHGTADTNVPPGESIQIYNALKILGKPVELVTVEGENHFISDYPKRQLWHNTIMAWFDRWLKNDPAWWDSIYK